MSSKKSQGNAPGTEHRKSETSLILPGEVIVSNHRGDILTDYRDSILGQHLKIVSSVIDALQRAIVCGCYLLDVKAILPHGALTNWRQANFAENTGFSERTSQRYMKTALQFSKFLAARELGGLEECKENPRLLLECVQAFHEENSREAVARKREPMDCNDWPVPVNVLEAVRQVLGDIECDPCALTDGDPLAEIQYTKKEDGLADSNPWPGTVLINPGHACDCTPWCLKALRELDSGNLSEAILCLPESTLRLVPQLLRYPIAISLSPLVVTFSNGDTSSQKALPTCSTFVYLAAKPKTELFATAFREIAAVFAPVAPDMK